MHAGIDPDIALNKQDKQVMIWTRGITYANSKNGFILNNNFSTSNYAIYIVLNSTNNIIENK